MMKYLCFIFGIALSFNTIAQDKNIENDTLTLEGIYNGKDIFVKNQFSNIQGFTVQSVILNKKVTKGEYNQSAFQIKLSEANLKLGDNVEIEIIHLKEKEPVVLNKEVLE